MTLKADRLTGTTVKCVGKGTVGESAGYRHVSRRTTASHEDGPNCKTASTK
jgi:hypothetical protein